MSLDKYLDDLFGNQIDITKKSDVDEGVISNAKIVIAKHVLNIRCAKVIICIANQSKQTRFRPELVKSRLRWMDKFSRENAVIIKMFKTYKSKLNIDDNEFQNCKSDIILNSCENVQEIINADIVITETVKSIATCRLLVGASEENFNFLITSINDQFDFNQEIEMNTVVIKKSEDPEEKKFHMFFAAAMQSQGYIVRVGDSNSNKKSDRVSIPVQDEAKTRLDQNIVRVLEGKKKINYDNIDIRDSDSIIYFAQNVQNEMFKDIDIVNYNLLKFKDNLNLSLYLSEASEELKQKSKIKNPNIIQKIFFPSCRREGGKGYIERKFNEFKSMIDNLENQLSSKIKFFDENSEILIKYKDNLIECKESFAKYLTKGENYLNNEAKRILTEVEIDSNSDPSDSIKANKLFEIKSNLKRIEQKIHDLKITSITSDQVLSTLTLLINSYTDIRSKLVSVVNTTIPLFKVSSFIQMTSEAINDTADFIEDMSKASSIAYESSMLSLEDSIKHYNEVTETKVDTLLEAFEDINKIIVNF